MLSVLSESRGPLKCELPIPYALRTSLMSPGSADTPSMLNGTLPKLTSMGMRLQSNDYAK